MRLLTAAMLILVLGMAGTIGSQAMFDPRVRPDVTDFDAFFAGARLASGGHAADAYSVAPLTAEEKQEARIEGGSYLPYLNPPVFMLVTEPLAWLPYLVAMAVFLAVGYAITSIGLKSILPPGVSWLPVLAFPGSAMNAIMTQNGFLTASCFAGGMLFLEKQPVLAGACLGGLVYKPQFAICVPVLLLAARRWAALASCAATAGGLACFALLAFGMQTWVAFLHAAPVGRAILVSQPQTWAKLVTIYSAVRLVHGGPVAAFGTQALGGLLALALLVRLGWRRAGGGPEIAALVAATFLCTPYAMDYDLTCLGVPLAWVMADAMKGGWRPWEKSVVLGAFILPLAARWLANNLALPVAPFFVAALFAVVWRRAQAGSAWPKAGGFAPSPQALEPVARWWRPPPGRSRPGPALVTQGKEEGLHPGSHHITLMCFSFPCFRPWGSGASSCEASSRVAPRRRPAAEPTAFFTP